MNYLHPLGTIFHFITRRNFKEIVTEQIVPSQVYHKQYKLLQTKLAKCLINFYIQKSDWSWTEAYNLSNRLASVTVIIVTGLNSWPTPVTRVKSVSYFCQKYMTNSTLALYIGPRIQFSWISASVLRVYFHVSFVLMYRNIRSSVRI
jgi:hypothetical protein